MKEGLPAGFQPGRDIICVQGLGFVGSAMALAIANARDKAGNPRYNVIGIDVPNDTGRERTDAINRGLFPLRSRGTCGL